MASAAINPNGHGRIICSPILTAKEPKRKIKYDL